MKTDPCDSIHVKIKQNFFLSGDLHKAFSMECITLLVKSSESSLIPIFIIYIFYTLFIITSVQIVRIKRVIFIVQTIDAILEINFHCHKTNNFFILFMTMKTSLSGSHLMFLQRKWYHRFAHSMFAIYLWKRS